MTRHTLILLATMFVTNALLAQEAYDKKAEWAFQQQVLNNRTRGEYQQVNWRKDAATAVKDAQAFQKPILVFILVDKHGQKGASDC